MKEREEKVPFANCGKKVEKGHTIKKKKVEKGHERVFERDVKKYSFDVVRFLACMGTFTFHMKFLLSSTWPTCLDQAKWT